MKQRRNESFLYVLTDFISLKWVQYKSLWKTFSTFGNGPPGPWQTHFFGKNISNMHCLHFFPQHKRHAQKTTKYVELIIVADNREVKTFFLQPFTVKECADGADASLVLSSRKRTESCGVARATAEKVLHGAAELGQCATSAVLWWQRHSLDRKCKTIPQRSGQEAGKKRSRVKTEESSHKQHCVVSPRGGPLLMSLTWMERMGNFNKKEGGNWRGD